MSDFNLDKVTSQIIDTINTYAKSRVDTINLQNQLLLEEIKSRNQSSREFDMYKKKATFDKEIESQYDPIKRAMGVGSMGIPEQPEMGQEMQVPGQVSNQPQMAGPQMGPNPQEVARIGGLPQAPMAETMSRYVPDFLSVRKQLSPDEYVKSKIAQKVMSGVPTSKGEQGLIKKSPDFKSFEEAVNAGQVPSIPKPPEGYRFNPERMFDTKAKMYIEDKRTTRGGASLQNYKDKRTENLIMKLDENNVKRQDITEAMEAAKRIQGGLYGKLARGWSRRFNPDDPALADWQKVKIVLTDAQLLNTAKTKGAISDREMELFAKAAANDDVVSIQQMMPVFNRLMRTLQADEDAAVKAYMKLYPEEGDPRTWEGMQPRQPTPQPEEVEFASEKEAEAANLPQGTVVIINGGRYLVE